MRTEDKLGGEEEKLKGRGGDGHFRECGVQSVHLARWWWASEVKQELWLAVVIPAAPTLTLIMDSIPSRN